MDLRTLRFIKRITQSDIQNATGIVQPRISLQETGIDTLSQAEKRKIEEYLNTSINWEIDKDTRPITRAEYKEIADILKLLFETRPGETADFLESCRSGREAYNALKSIQREVILMIPMPKMKYGKH
jgi:transcriptional regulator with XRE-family HTH domain